VCLTGDDRGVGVHGVEEAGRLVTAGVAVGTGVVIGSGRS
jgi:hypothetical protein